MSGVVKLLQRLGRSLMLPVAVLPVCGILMGVGCFMCPAAVQGGAIEGPVALVGFFLTKAGGALINNIAILFAVGVAVGMSKDSHGTAALAGLVSYLLITTLVSTDVVCLINPNITEGSVDYVAYTKIQNPFIGILSGCIGAACYNHFSRITLPDALAFFSGKQFVAIATAGISTIAAAILAFAWPLAFEGLAALGNGIAQAGGIGVGIYAFLQRLLIPFGLHHALNSVFWFDTIGLGDLTSYWAGKTSADVGWSLGCYMSGFFPCMMFGIPGAAVAIWRTAKNKKRALGIMLSAALCAFICGITEPFEFTFMFICFPLYVVYAILYGIVSIVVYYIGFRAGFCFSAGGVDLLLSSTLPAAENTWMIIPLGLATFAAFYFVFRIAISAFNIPTPGREKEEDVSGEATGGATGVNVGTATGGATGVNVGTATGGATGVATDTITGVATDTITGVAADAITDATTSAMVGAATGATTGETAGETAGSATGVIAGVTAGSSDEKQESAEDASKVLDRFGDKGKIALGVLNAIGGAENIAEIDCCATRLRMELNDAELVDRAACKKAGALDVLLPDKKSAQVIIGTQVQQVCEAIKELIKHSNSKIE